MLAFSVWTNIFTGGCQIYFKMYLEFRERHENSVMLVIVCAAQDKCTSKGIFTSFSEKEDTLKNVGCWHKFTSILGKNTKEGILKNAGCCHELTSIIGRFILLIQTTVNYWATIKQTFIYSLMKKYRKRRIWILECKSSLTVGLHFLLRIYLK